MSQVALYRSWRPMDFDSVVAQQQVVQTLKQAVKNGEIGHAYLFCGTRGTGKTSLAKILARAVNCLQPREGNPCNECSICRGILDGSLLDVQEIDAASNNSVDNIRRLIDEIVFLPISARYKVYIIDEVHMLSTGAFNALLKTLEEPPAHAIFVLATTEPHRIPATILSRCQRFDFRRIPDEAIAGRLREIAEEEKIVADEAALQAIAVLGDGALRDAISLLDQCRLSFPEGIRADSVLALVGSVNKLFCAEVAEQLLRGDVAAVLDSLAAVVAEGRDLARFSTELAGFFRDLMVAQVAPGKADLITGSLAEKQKIAELAPAFELAGLRAALLDLGALSGELRWSDQPRLSLEICLIKIVGRLRNSAQAEALPTAVQNPNSPAVPPAQPVPAAHPVPTTQPIQAAPPILTAQPAPAAERSASPDTAAPVTPVASESAAATAALPAAAPVSERAETTAVAPIAAAPASAEPMTFELEFDQALPTPPDRVPAAETQFVEPAPAATPQAVKPEPAAAEQRGEPAPLEFLSQEDVALLSPELLLQLSRESQTVEQKPDATETAKLRTTDGSFDPDALLRIWEKTLSELGPYLFLFAQEVRPHPRADALELFFAKGQEPYYNVLSSAQADEMHLLWQRNCAPEKVPLRLLTDFPSEEAPTRPEPREDDWITRIRRVAAENNIPFEEVD